MRMLTVVPFTSVRHEGYSRRTESGDYVGNVFNIFPLPFIPLSFLHLSESCSHSNNFVSVLTSFLFTLLHKKGGEQDSAQLQSLVPSPPFQDWCTGKIQSFKPLQAVSAAALCSGEGATHTYPSVAAENNSGACARLQVLEEMLLLESCCLPAFLPCGQRWWWASLMRRLQENQFLLIDNIHLTLQGCWSLGSRPYVSVT